MSFIVVLPKNIVTHKTNKTQLFIYLLKSVLVGTKAQTLIDDELPVIILTEEYISPTPIYYVRISIISMNII